MRHTGIAPVVCSVDSPDSEDGAAAIAPLSFPRYQQYSPIAAAMVITFQKRCVPRSMGSGLENGPTPPIQHTNFTWRRRPFCAGLDRQQVVSIIMTWRKTHGLSRSLKQLDKGIIPAAWREVSLWVSGWHADRSVAEKARNATKTTKMILAYITAEGSPKTPSSIAAALDIPGERVKMAVQRLEKRYKLRRTKEGYILG